MEIYLLENTINGKRYVGLTTKGANERFKNHIWRANSNKPHIKRNHLHNSIRKYGPEAFTITILEKCKTIEELHLAEKKWINHYNTFGGFHGLNETYGGEGKPGHVTNGVTKEKLRNYRLGRKVDEETKQKISKSLRGRIFSEDHREKLSRAQEGEKNHRYGIPLPEERKKTMAQQMSGKNNPFFGKAHSEETKNILSEKNKGRFSGSKNPAAKPCRYMDRFYETGVELRKSENITLAMFYTLKKKGLITYEDSK